MTVYHSDSDMGTQLYSITQWVFLWEYFNCWNRCVYKLMFFLCLNFVIYTFDCWPNLPIMQSFEYPNSKLSSGTFSIEPFNWNKPHLKFIGSYRPAGSSRISMVFPRTVNQLKMATALPLQQNILSVNTEETLIFMACTIQSCPDLLSWSRYNCQNTTIE